MLREQLVQLKVAKAYDPSDPMVKYSPRRAHRRGNLPITGGMGHEQMVREAKLRAQHNKQRAQLKGYIRYAYYHGCYGCYGYFGYMTTYHDLLFTAYGLLLTTMPTH